MSNNEEPLFPRENYLKKIRPFYDDSEMIKVLTGVRRCGKSSILRSVQEELLTKGIPSENIININLDAKENRNVTTPNRLEKAIDRKCKNINGKKYLFVDEVQNVKGFEKVINAYREERDYSIFITGSNSYLLSGKLVTKLTGRYIEFEINTLTFDEYLEMKKFLGIKLEAESKELINYIQEGGFPRTLFYNELPVKRVYVKSVIDEIFEKDVKPSKKVRNKELFSLVQQFIINNYGSTISIDGLCKYLTNTQHVKVKKDTVYRYVQVLNDLKIVSECKRFDLKSKRSLNGGQKYYLSDLSFYFLTNTDNRIDYGPALENIVYRYAKAKENEISIGRIGNLEIDFILRKPDLTYAYVQVARTIDNGIVDEDGLNVTEEREYRPLESLKDNYPKYVLTLDVLLQRRNGIIHENICEFMSKNKDF